MKYQSLHIGNVANIGYSMCKILNKHTVSARLIFHDEYHLMSQPEWNDYALDPNDYEHEFFLKINKKNIHMLNFLPGLFDTIFIMKEFC